MGTISTISQMRMDLWRMTKEASDETTNIDRG